MGLIKLIFFTNNLELRPLKRLFYYSYVRGLRNDMLKLDFFLLNFVRLNLNLKPQDPEEFAAMSTRELQNGRLAMLAVAGFVAQELVDGKEIFVELGLAPDTFDPSSLPVQF